MDLSELTTSPRFQEACQVYGLGSVDDLLPPAEQRDACFPLEAKLYARREKRRLLELGSVLVERQRLIDRLPQVAAPGATSETRHVPTLAESTAAAVQAAHSQTKQFMAEEKKRALYELRILVEAEKKAGAWHKHELERQELSATAEYRRVRQQEAKRRASVQVFHKERDERRERVLAADLKRLDEKRLKLQQQRSAYEARREVRSELAAKELARQRRKVRARFDAVHRSLDQQDANYFALTEQRSSRPSTSSTPNLKPMVGQSLGKISPPLHLNKFAQIQHAHAREHREKEEELETRVRQQEKRLEVNEKMRELSVQLRRAAFDERVNTHKQHLSEVHAKEEAEKRAVGERMEREQAVVAAHQERRRIALEQQRQYGHARDEEKARGVERAMRARQYEHEQLVKEQQKTVANVDAFKRERLEASLSGQKKVSALHDARGSLKEELRWTPVDSWVRKNSNLLQKLDVQPEELLDVGAQAIADVGAHVLGLY